MASPESRPDRRGRFQGWCPMTVFSVNHVTTYSYAAPVRLGEHRMMLRPRDSNDQRLLNATLDIEPPSAETALDSRRLRQLRRR